MFQSIRMKLLGRKRLLRRNFLGLTDLTVPV
ncbi:Uncharacterised protein [Segatella copri]|nr:Uncharacterised protein [Segatella copri]